MKTIHNVLWTKHYLRWSDDDLLYLSWLYNSDKYTRGVDFYLFFIRVAIAVRKFGDASNHLCALEEWKVDKYQYNGINESYEIAQQNTPLATPKE